MWGSKINILTVHGSQSALVNRSNIILIFLIAHWIGACEQIECVFRYHVLIPMTLWLMDDFLIFWNNASPGPRGGCTAPEISCCALGHRECGGGSAVWGLAQSFSKSILALQALDNLENIIQNSPFQHVSSIKGVFSSRVSTMRVWPRNAQIRLERKRKSSFILSPSLSKRLSDPAYVCLFTLLWKFLLRTENLNYGVSWYCFIFKAFFGGRAVGMFSIINP